MTVHDQELQFHVDFPGDEAELQFWARVKTIAINASQLFPLLPWEEHIVVPSSLPAVPVAMALPDSVLNELSILRMTQHELLSQNGENKTLEDCIRLMRKHTDQLQGDHVSFRLDMAFLEQSADKLLRTKVIVDAILLFSLAPRGS